MLYILLRILFLEEILILEECWVNCIVLSGNIFILLLVIVKGYFFFMWVVFWSFNIFIVWCLCLFLRVLWIIIVLLEINFFILNLVIGLYFFIFFVVIIVVILICLSCVIKWNIFFLIIGVVLYCWNIVVIELIEIFLVWYLRIVYWIFFIRVDKLKLFIMFCFFGLGEVFNINNFLLLINCCKF